MDPDVWALSVLADSGPERAQTLALCHHRQWEEREKEPGLFAWCMISLKPCWNRLELDKTKATLYVVSPNIWQNSMHCVFEGNKGKKKEFNSVR